MSSAAPHIEQPPDGSTSWEPTPTMNWRREWFRGALLGLAAVAVLLLHQRFAADFELVDDDAVSSWQPVFTDFARQVGEGRVPVWSHHTACGYPLLGWTQPSFTYPPMWLAHGLGSLLGIEAGEFFLVTLMHSFAAAAAAFVYLRRFGVHPLAAATAGLSVSLSGVLLGLGASWPTYVFAAAWWPMVFLTLEELRVEYRFQPGGPPKGGTPTLTLGLLGGLAFLFVDLMLMVKMTILAGLYVLLRFEGRTLLSVLKPLGVATVVALAIGVGQWAPAVEIIVTSARTAMGSNDHYTAPPLLWLGWIFPFWTLPWEATTYSSARAAGGFFVGPCAVLGLLFAVRWFRPLRGPHRALLILTALYVSLALGNLWKPNDWLQRLPVFSSFRWPMRWMFEASCTLALLSGFGLHLAFRDLSNVRGRSLVFGFVALVACTIWMPLPKPAGLEARSIVMLAVWGVALVALCWLAARGAAPAFLGGVFLWTAVSLAANVPVAQQTRMARMTRLLDDPLHVAGDAQERILFLARHSDVLFANKQGNLARSFPHRFGARTVLGYVYRLPGQAWMTGFELDGSIYENEAELARRFVGPDSTMLSALRVGHVVVFKFNEALAAACSANPSLKLQRETDFYRIYRHDGFKAPAFLARELRRESDPQDVVDLGLRTRMPEGALVEPAYSGPMKFSGRGQVTNFREHHGEISFDVDASEDAFAIVTTTYAPRWRAKIDDVDVPLVRVNGSFIGLRVPSGNHRVRLEYWPRDHVAYLVASAVSLTLVAGMWLLTLRRRSRDGERGA